MVYHIRHSPKIYKYWNKHIRRLPFHCNGHFRHFLSWSAQVHCLASALLLASCMVIVYLRTAFFFLQEGVYVLDSLFLRLKDGSTWMGTLIVKTVECGALKTDVRCLEIISICKNLFLMCTALKMNSGSIFLWRNWWSKGHFSICSNNALFMTLLVSLKRNKSKINGL